MKSQLTKVEKSVIKKQIWHENLNEEEKQALPGIELEWSQLIIAYKNINSLLTKRQIEVELLTLREGKKHINQRYKNLKEQIKNTNSKKPINILGKEYFLIHIEK